MKNWTVHEINESDINSVANGDGVEFHKAGLTKGMKEHFLSLSSDGRRLFRESLHDDGRGALAHNLFVIGLLSDNGTQYTDV
jgi:hypothetical protein